MNYLSKNLFFSQQLQAQPGDEISDLKDNMWPRPLAFWLVIGYLALTIIRPWELLFPWMADVHFERSYMILMGMVVVSSHKERFPALNFQNATMVLFSLILLLNILTAYHRTMAWDTFYVYLAFIIFYFLLLLELQTSYRLFFTLASYIFVMVLYLGKSQWEFWVHGQHRYDMGVVRMVGIEESYGGPNALAMSIVVSMPVALFLWRHRKEFVAFWPEKWGKSYFLMLKLYWILAIWSLVMTNSRSGIVSFLFFLILSISRMKFTKLIVYFMGCIIFLGVAWQVIPEQNKGRFRTIWAPEEGPANAKESADGRIEGFKAGMDMFYQHPIMGVGLGNFVYYRYFNLDGIPLQAHNLPGQLLGELGLLGAASFLLMVAATLWSCRKIKILSRMRLRDPTLWIDFATACRDSIFLLFFSGIFGHNMLRYSWLWMGVFALRGVFLLENFSEDRK